MANAQPVKTPQQELKEKLKQTRASYTRAQKLLAEVEKTHEKFTKLKDALLDKDAGVEANAKWLADRRTEIQSLVKQASDQLSQLETAAASVSSAVKDITDKHSEFSTLAVQVFDEKDGLAAILKAAQKLRTSTDRLAKKIGDNKDTSEAKLAEITTTTKSVAAAYEDFLEKKKLVDDKEIGLEAQLRRAADYANSVQEAKTKSEGALVSVTKFKETSEALVSEIQTSKTTVEGYQKESKTLTDDIRNTLNKATQFTLSQALQDRTQSFSRQMYFWAFLQIVAIIALSLAVLKIFDVLFMSQDGTHKLLSTANSPTVVSVVSKFLFTTPLIFAVYYTTSNFRHARDLRDKYAWKETVAKNFQNYIKLVKDEFKDPKYEEERFRFSMETVRSIYHEPNPVPKRRKYNLSLYNRIVEANIEEEDLQQLKSAVVAQVSHELSGAAEKAVEATVVNNEKAAAIEPEAKAKTVGKVTTAPATTTYASPLPAAEI